MQKKPGRQTTFLPDQTWSTRYSRARAQARYRGEAWTLTPQEYMQLWRDSGAQPGRSHGTACMVRKDTSLPWSKDNCEIRRRSKISDSTLTFQYHDLGYVNGA